jgi:hypothetical protein
MLVSRAAATTRGPRRPLLAGRSAALLAAFAAGALALAGCQANPTPPPLASTSTSPTPSPSPAIAAPTLPAEAQGTSKAAAKAFVRHWIDVLNYSAESGDTNTLRELSDSRCAACAGAIQSIDEVYSAGGAMHGDGWSVLDLKYQPLQPRHEPVVAVGLRIAPQRVIPASGKESRRFKGGARTMSFYLKRQRGAWVVVQLERTT